MLVLFEGNDGHDLAIVCTKIDGIADVVTRCRKELPS